MLRSLIIAVATLAVASPVLAQTPAANQTAPSTTAPKKDPNRMICERQEEIGSRLGGTKVCHTAAEWDAARKDSRDQVEDWQRKLTDPGKPAG